MSETRQFIDWPGWRHLVRALLLALVLIAWFAAVYGGADYLTHLRSMRVRVHLDVESQIPFVPEMTLAYMSIYPLFWLGPFVLRQSRQLQALARVLALTIFGGGIGFVLFPAELAYRAPVVNRQWEALFAVADRLNLTYNLVPSLHVALATACVAIYTRYSRTPTTTGLWAWCAAIAASTVLTHQHHLVDVVSGFALGYLLGRVVYPRWDVRSGTATVAAFGSEDSGRQEAKTSSHPP